MEFRESPQDHLWRRSFLSWGQSSDIAISSKEGGHPKETWEAQRREMSSQENREFLPSSFHPVCPRQRLTTLCYGVMDYCWGVTTEMIGAGYLKRWKWSDFFVCVVGLCFFSIGCIWICMAVLSTTLDIWYCPVLCPAGNCLVHSSVLSVWRRDEYVSGKMHDSLLFYCILQIQPLMMKLPT